MIELELELLEKIINKYGVQEQLRQTMGECGELIAVIQNFYRAIKYGNRTETFDDVLEEAVDVYFMIQQIRTLDPNSFDELCHTKKSKLLKKLENE